MKYSESLLLGIQKFLDSCPVSNNSGQFARLLGLGLLVYAFEGPVVVRLDLLSGRCRLPAVSQGGMVGGAVKWLKIIACGHCDRWLLLERNNSPIMSFKLPQGVVFCIVQGEHPMLSVSDIDGLCDGGWVVCGPWMLPSEFDLMKIKGVVND